MKKEAYWEKLSDSAFLVYQWRKRYNRFICTHMWENQRDAELTVNQIHRRQKKHAEARVQRKHRA